MQCERLQCLHSNTVVRRLRLAFKRGTGTITDSRPRTVLDVLTFFPEPSLSAAIDYRARTGRGHLESMVKDSRFLSRLGLRV